MGQGQSIESINAEITELENKLNILKEKKKQLDKTEKLAEPELLVKEDGEELLTYSETEKSTGGKKRRKKTKKHRKKHMKKTGKK